MDKQIIRLFQEEKTEDLRALLSGVSGKELSSLIDRRAVKGHGDPAVLIRAILSGLSGVEKDCLKSRFTVYKHCINLLRNVELNAKTVRTIIDVLVSGLDDLPAGCLAELASEFVESIKNGTATSGYLEMLPRIVSAVDAQDLVSFEDHQMPGAEYKNHIINSICSGRWDGRMVLLLVVMFKDISLRDEELKFVLTKAIRMMKEVQLQELPPLIYQMLLLSNKGHKRLVLEGVIHHFVQQDKLYKSQPNNPHEQELEVTPLCIEQLYVVEGTIILHIRFAVQQDQELGKQLIKYLKTEQQSPTSLALEPFCIALALSCIKIHRFEDQILEFLKMAILKHFKDAERQNRSQWTSDMVALVKDVTSNFMDTVKSSVHGWDHVIQGLVLIGFTLMDVYGPKAAFGRFVPNTPTTITTPSQRACRLGSAILLETFKIHELVQQEILEQILNRIVTKATTPVSHYLDLLSKIVKCAPQIILDSLSKVQEAFDYLTYLPARTAEALLKAVKPLLKVSMPLKDSLILVLRKAMFSRQVEARCMAVQGFLMILKYFKVLGGVSFSQCSQSSSASQILVDIHIPYDPSHNEGFCLEILGYLRRCLTQQAGVRMTLYMGLLDVLNHNSQLASVILKVLCHQLAKYYETTEDMIPPLKLEPCIMLQSEDVYTQEPLAHLLHAAVHCLLKSKQLNDDQLSESEGILQELEEILESLTQRMLKSDLDSFELDRSADFSLGTSVGVRNNIFALLLSGIYEVLMEYTYLTGQLEVSSCETVLQLYKKNHQLLEIMKEKSSGGATGSKKKQVPTRRSPGCRSAVSKHNSMLSFEFINNIITALFGDVQPDLEAGLTCLQNSRDFKHYILTVTLHKITQLSQSGSCDGDEALTDKTILKYCTNITRTLQKAYAQSLENTVGSQQDKHIQINVLCLEIVAKIYTVVCAMFKEHLPAFLSTVDDGCDYDNEDDINLQTMLYTVVKKLQTMVSSVIEAEDDCHSPKEAFQLLVMIDTLTRQLDKDGVEIAEILEWLRTLCTEQNIDDVSLTKLLMSQLFRLSSEKGSCVQLLRLVAVDIHSQLGDIDQEVEFSQSSTMPIINQCTAAPTILLLVLTQVDIELDDTEWVLNMLKGTIMTTESDKVDDDDSGTCTQTEKQEKSLCSRLGYLVNTFHELCQSAIPAGVCVMALIKALCHLYGVLTSLVKYYLHLYQMKRGYVTTRFEKLIKLSATNLTSYVYAMITYLQATQSEALKLATEKTKKDKRKQEALAQAGKNHVLKESKSIPNLIFAIEQYERYLIQLSKKSKIQLMNHFKMSTARDFRINVACLEEALQDTDDQEDQPEEETVDQSTNQPETPGNDSRSENQEPPAKRSKVTEQPAKQKTKQKLKTVQTN